MLEIDLTQFNKPLNDFFEKLYHFLLRIITLNSFNNEYILNKDGIGFYMFFNLTRYSKEACSCHTQECKKCLSPN